MLQGRSELEKPSCLVGVELGKSDSPLANSLWLQCPRELGERAHVREPLSVPASGFFGW